MVKKDIQKGSLIYEGKGKRVYQNNLNPDEVIIFFKDDLTAFQGRKKDFFLGKGKICNLISSSIFSYLSTESISHHWLQILSGTESLCKKVKMIPLEVVIRNFLAGSTAKKFQIKEGTPLKEPLLEYYYKKDSLDDPFVSKEQIQTLSLIDDFSLLPMIEREAYLINQCLTKFFSEAGFRLIDFKMEFGIDKNNKLFLADDISPDSARIWEKDSNYFFDKDRFRRGLGKVKEGYQEIEKRIINKWGLP